jgi:hypothetical protein
LRILVSNDDTHAGRPLHEAIVRAARDAELAGITVVRGIAGYGRSTHIHEVFRGFSYDLPVVIEVIDAAEKIDGWLATLEGLRQGALVTRETVQILLPSGPETSFA